MALEPSTLRHDRALELLSQLRRLTGGMRYAITTPGASSTMSVHDQSASNFDHIEKVIRLHQGSVESGESVTDGVRAMRQSLYRGDDTGITEWHPKDEL